jgi:hypothetical protein
LGSNAYHSTCQGFRRRKLGRPKKPDDGGNTEDAGDFASFIERLEQDIIDIYHGDGEEFDTVLNHIVMLTIMSLSEGRPLFPNLMDEPYLYAHYIKNVVRDEIHQDRIIAEKQAADIAALNRK